MRIEILFSRKTFHYPLEGADKFPLKKQANVPAPQATGRFLLPLRINQHAIAAQRASAPAGMTCYGLVNGIHSRATVENSVMTGKDHGVSINSALTRIINTRIDGGVVNNPTGKQCR